MTLGGAEDRRLAAAIAESGDEAAFRTLYGRHTPALYRLALRLGGGDEPWAEDLVQQAWIRAVESLPGFQWRSAFRTWLSGIAINCAREGWRERRLSLEVLVAGEKLREVPDVVIGAGGAVTTAAPAASKTRLAGFFIVRAADARRAVELARSCPHVRYGGSIVIREIEPT